MQRLSNATLASASPGVELPGYDRSAVTAGIVHLGLGAFHRAHQAVFADDALNRGETGWGIIAASLRSADTRDALAPQDGLYTFALRDGETTKLRVIGSVIRMIVAPEDPEALIAAIAEPGIKLVTLTITEKGYAVDRGRLDRDDPAVRRDLAGDGTPTSALGFLAAGLQRRQQAGAPEVTIVSCDNLPKNGETLKAVLLEFAGLKHDGLADWIEANVAFASSMVDRIVPATTEADRSEVDAGLGLSDAWPVMAEPAFDWIVEDRFPVGRPPFEPSGVRFVEDVEPYEQMKLRLLNGAHTAIAAIGRLAGYETVPEAVADVRIQRFLKAYWTETAPTLSIDPAVAATYGAALLPRFANRALPHRTAQIATDASQKVPQRLLSPLHVRRKAGESFGAILFAVAAWIRSCGGIDDAGRPFTVNDPMFERWIDKPTKKVSPSANIEAFLGFESVFGATLREDPEVTSELKRLAEEIAEKGVLATLDARFGSN